MDREVASFCLFFLLLLKPPKLHSCDGIFLLRLAPWKEEGGPHLTAPKSSPAPGASSAGQDWGLQAQREVLRRLLPPVKGAGELGSREAHLRQPGSCPCVGYMGALGSLLWDTACVSFRTLFWGSLPGLVCVSEDWAALDHPFPCLPLDWPFLVEGLCKATPRGAGQSREPCGEPSGAQ